MNSSSSKIVPKKKLRRALPTRRTRTHLDNSPLSGDGRIIEMGSKVLEGFLAVGNESGKYLGRNDRGAGTGVGPPMNRSFLILSGAIVIGFVLLNAFQDTARLGAAGPLSLTPVARAEGRKPDRQEIIDRFLKLWAKRPGNTVFENRWLGVKTLQNPNDVWITQEILFEVKPDFLVETGTLFGGSAALWAMILEQINPAARVITIDIKDRVTEAKKLDIFRRKVDFLIGSSTDPEIVAEVRRRTKGKKIVVLLDSAHEKDHVLNELEAYSPLVAVGSYLIVQDTVVNGHPIWPNFGPGPHEAVEEFLATNDQFEPDHSRERLLLTLCRDGYLKRIR
jgi:cephalosporin hydroxylase